jgi:hypothetical protein
MTWVRIDDQLHSHPKIRHAWRIEPAAIGLHVLALSYASCHLTDGTISEDFVHYQLPVQSKRDKAIEALEESGLWERNGSAWTIHDYLEYNRSRAQTVARRQADAARKRGGR